ncbi:MAG: hypothetical protein GY750_18430 [Lentisphaerae bacterium]|nr:hypothetical protein [Lentisphaerota bacterium]MCP4103375.1 hypothetical protein [Lentisphaerota bacterium]
MKKLIIAVIILVVAALIFIVTCREPAPKPMPKPAVAVRDSTSKDAAFFVREAVLTFQTKEEAEFMKMWAEVPPEQYASALKCLKRGKGQFKVERVMQQQNSKDVFYVDGKLNSVTLEFVVRKTDDGFKIENVYEMM